MLKQIENYIMNDDKDKLIELAFDVKTREAFNKIFDFFLKEKDYYYVGELLSVCPDLVDPIEDAKK